MEDISGIKCKFSDHLDQPVLIKKDGGHPNGNWHCGTCGLYIKHARSVKTNEESRGRQEEIRKHILDGTIGVLDDDQLSFLLKIYNKIGLSIPEVLRYETLMMEVAKPLNEEGDNKVAEKAAGFTESVRSLIKIKSSEPERRTEKCRAGKEVPESPAVPAVKERKVKIIKKKEV